jgi:hypothetical protein
MEKLQNCKEAETEINNELLFQWRCFGVIDLRNRLRRGDDDKERDLSHGG